MTTPVALMLTLNGIVHEPPSRRRTAVKRVSSRSWDYSNQPIESQLNRCSSDSTLISTVHTKSDEWPVEPICQLTSEHSQVKAKLPSDSDSSSPPAAANIISTSNMTGDIDLINLDPLVIDDHSCTPTIPSDSQNDKEEQNDADAVETKRKAVEYAHKLNFSEAMIQQALEELGGSPTRDELLKRILEIQKDNPQTEAEAVPQVHHQPATPSSSLDSTDASSTASSESSDNLRYIVIDGSNVAMCHGNKQVFSCRGIQLVVDWFVERGHRVTAFVPSWRREEPRTDNKVEDREILFELEKKGYLSFTPSRRVAGMRVTSHDDRYILDLAHVEDGIVVSNDYFRDLAQESDEYKTITEQRLLMFSFANDRFMPPADPLGRYGPSLENFLRKKPLPTEKPPPDCPYGAKCTYGLKCKYYHADRPRYKGSVKPGHSFPMMRSRRHPPLRESVSDSHALLSNQCPPQAMTPMTQREASDPTVSASQVRGHREVKRQLAFALGHRKQPQPTSPNMGRSLQPLTSTMSADAAVYNPGTTITGSYWPNVAGHPFVPASPFHLVPPSHFNAPVDFQALRNDISERLKASFDAPKVAYIMCKYPDVYDTQQLAYLITQEFPPS